MKNKIWLLRYWFFKRFLLLFNKRSVITFTDSKRYAVDILKLNKMGNFAIKFIKPPHFQKVIIR